MTVTTASERVTQRVDEIGFFPGEATVGIGLATEMAISCRTRVNRPVELQMLPDSAWRHVEDRADRLFHLQRYIKALTIRAERASVNFEKDQIKAGQIAKFSELLNEMLQTLSPTVSEEKKKATEDFFWLLEEYKVTLFAQELGTAISVSAKRLEKKLDEINRMI